MKSKTTLFSPTFKVQENKVPLFFSFLASMMRYCHFVLLTSQHVLLKSPVEENPWSLKIELSFLK